jgi:L-fuconolactonase
VQAAPTEAETRYLLDLANETPSVAGVVGWVDMEAADAPARIAALARLPKLVGLRPMIHDIADPRWMLSSRPAPAFVAIVESGLVFDALVRPIHLRPLLTLAGRYPELRVVIDHGAKPAIARWTPGGDDFTDWAQKLRRLGRRPGIACKVSGLVTEAAPSWHPEDLVPYLDLLLEAFGPDRLIFGSDWPVVNLGGGFARWLDVLLAWLDLRLDPPARDAVLGRNAARLYKLSMD